MPSSVLKKLIAAGQRRQTGPGPEGGTDASSLDAGLHAVKRRSQGENAELKKRQELKSLDTPLARFLAQKNIRCLDNHFISPEHVSYFSDLFCKWPSLSTVLNIGFNYGHSADLFLHLSDTVRVVSLENKVLEPVAREVCQYLTDQYKGRHLLVAGNSSATVPSLPSFLPFKFDLIFMDGSILGDQIDEDIKNCRLVSGAQTLVVMDGLKPFSKGGVARFTSWNRAVSSGQIEEVEIKSANEMVYVWGSFRYLPVAGEDSSAPAAPRAERMSELDRFYRSDSRTLLWQFTKQLEQATSLPMAKGLWDQLMHTKIELDEWTFNSYLKILRSYRDPTVTEIQRMRDDKFPRGGALASEASFAAPPPESDRAPVLPNMDLNDI